MAGCSKDFSSSTASDSFSAGTNAFSDGHDYDTESEEERDQERTVVSLLDGLKSASAADIARLRKTKRNECCQPPRGKRQCKGAVSSDPKGVSPQQHVREFTTESLTVSHGHLFCTMCRERLSLKCSIIRNHVQSSKH